MTTALFVLEGREVQRGDVVYHRDLRRTGGKVTAEFPAKGDYVTVRAYNGAVPEVRVSELSWTRHPEDIERDLFYRQLRKYPNSYYYNATERDFEMWQLGRKSLAKTEEGEHNG